jgi:hypothetical protein
MDTDELISFETTKGVPVQFKYSTVVVLVRLIQHCTCIRESKRH